LRVDGHILRAQGDGCSRQQQLHLRQIRRGHADTGTATHSTQTRLDLVQKRLVGRQATIHLPVANDQFGLAHA